jgi:hypothetical protein
MSGFDIEPVTTRVRSGKQNRYTVPSLIRARLGSGPLLNAARAARLLKISKTELYRRSKEGIYPYVIDEDTNWWWYSELKLREITGEIPLGPPKKKRGRPPKIVQNLPVPKKSIGRPSKKPSDSHLNGASSAAGFRGNLTGPIYNGETAKLVFGELEKNQSAVQIVLTLGIHPEIVKTICASYADLKGGLLLTMETKQAIEALPLQGELPITSCSHLIKVLQKSIGVPIPCARCGTQKARLCVGCASTPAEPQL